MRVLRLVTVALCPVALSLVVPLRRETSNCRRFGNGGHCVVRVRVSLPYLCHQRAMKRSNDEMYNSGTGSIDCTQTTKQKTGAKEDNGDRISVSIEQKVAMAAATATAAAATDGDMDDYSDSDDTTAVAARDGPAKAKLSLPERFERMRIEAMFHPKFDNEQQNDRSIRTKMEGHMAAGNGYLEVSLKHSGSLILWSGGCNFYSKNSMSNQFTLVAEILLRQHFYRAWQAENGDKASEPLSHEAMYDKCSECVKENRLTLAFEVVTAVLGDHGAIPHRDFLVLTAVADRNDQRFYTTPEIIQFAQAFRLPHNDAYVFSSLKSTSELFRLYETCRETGTASDVIPELTMHSNVHVSSLYPHDVFQGDILEGFIVRYVPFSEHYQRDDVHRLMSKLGEESRRLLNLVPPSRPDPFVLAKRSDEKSPILRANLRDVFKSINKEEEKAAQFDFCDELMRIVNASSVPLRAIEKTERNNDTLPITLSMITNSGDRETSMIAGMIRKLKSMTKDVRYVTVRETDPDGSSKRWLCTIHVIHDSTFRKFQTIKDESDLPLYRGFCIELIPSSDNIVKIETVDADAEKLVDKVAETEQTDSEFLMLKMKLLPYMVRTFICRNCMSLAMEDRPDAFIERFESLFPRWGMSDAALERWRPFFMGWHQYLSTQYWKTAGNDLPGPTGFNYLEYLDQYTALYEKGTFPIKQSDFQFNAFLLVVAYNDEEANEIASRISKYLEGSRVCKQNDVGKASRLRGVICTTGLEGWPKHRNLLERSKGHSILLRCGVDQETIEQKVGDTESSTYKKLSALSKKANSANADYHVTFPFGGDEESKKEAFEKAVNECRKFSDSIVIEVPKMISPGALIFCPGIPGCGKSTIISNIQSNDILPHLSSSMAQPVRIVQVLVGDRAKQKKGWWKILADKWKVDASGVFVADKNAPPSAWESVAQACARANGTPMPVIPDDLALRTTKINGKMTADGGLINDAIHFYPYSLEYLAVCMARVLQRKPGSHDGKLDRGVKLTCMIVVSFFTFYENISSEDFLETMQSQFDKSNANQVVPIRVPFFKSSESLTLPEDLESILVEALRNQEMIKKLDDEDSRTIELETRLREVITKYSEMLLESASSLNVTLQAFSSSALENIASLVHEKNAAPVAVAKDTSVPSKSSKAEKCSNRKAQLIMLASVDVPNNTIVKILCDNEKNVQKFLRLAVGERYQLGQLKSKKIKYPGSIFVGSTHVTLAHQQRTSQDEMRRLFGPLQGQSVDLTITSLLWDERTAALAVTLPKKTKGGKDMPPSANDFCHITIWFETGVKAFEANQLNAKADSGKANKFEFDPPIILEGKVSFWGLDYKVLPIKI